MIDLRLGDCLELMKAIPDGSVDLVYADMMYDNLDFAWVDEAVRSLSITGSIYVQTDYRSVAQLKLYCDRLAIFQNWIVWCYKAMPKRQSRYQRKHDDILFYTKSEKYCWNNPEQPPSRSYLKRFKADESGKVINGSRAMKARGSDCYIRNVVCRDWWDDIPVPSGFNRWDTDRKIHPWQKPIAILDRIVGASSNEGDTVLDPFMGSGTTGVACVKLNRNFIGMEINPDYFAIAERRIAEAQTQAVMAI